MKNKYVVEYGNTKTGKRRIIAFELPASVNTLKRAKFDANTKYIAAYEYVVEVKRIETAPVKNPRYRVSDPAHAKIIKDAAKHFAMDERAAKKPRKKRAKAKTARRKNPAPLLYIITAKGTGKKMHYDGEKFSERARVVTFKTPDAAAAKARELIAKFPVLNKYRIAVEHNQHLPPRGAASPKK